MEYVKGDIFKTPMSVIVVPVNCIGVMGKGLALEARKRVPGLFKDYQRACVVDGSIHVGKNWFWQSSEYPKGILCMPTKYDWRKPSTTTYIDMALDDFITYYQEWGIDSIAFPKIGCGLGQLDWESQVHPMLLKYCGNLDIPIEVYL